MQFVRKAMEFARSEAGPTAVEYAVMLALIIMVALAAITLLGAPFNSSQFGLPLQKKLLYFFFLLPPTAAAALAAVVVMPRYAGRRRQVLVGRRAGRGWLLRALLFDRKRMGETGVVGRHG